MSTACFFVNRVWVSFLFASYATLFVAIYGWGVIVLCSPVLCFGLFFSFLVFSLRMLSLALLDWISFIFLMFFFNCYLPLVYYKNESRESRVAESGWKPVNGKELSPTIVHL